MSDSEYEYSTENDRRSRYSISFENDGDNEQLSENIQQKAGAYETDSELQMYSDDDNDCESFNSDRRISEFDADTGYHDQTAFNDISERERKLLQLNERINAQTKKLGRETEELIKDHEEKLRREPKLTGMVMNTSMRARKTTTARPIDGASGDTHTSRNRMRSNSRLTSRSVLDPSMLEDDEIDEAALQMAPDAAMRFYKARVKAMEQDMKEMIEELRSKDQHIGELESQNKKLNESCSRHERNLRSTQVKLDKLKESQERIQTKNRTLDHENKELQREVGELRKREKRMGTDPQSGRAGRISQHDLRYNRALDEIEKLKTQVNEAEKERRELTESYRKKKDKLQAENKLLERQRHDLMLAFKKQMKLIGILKRQKLHIETARVLSFSEDQFLKVIDLGQEIN